MSDIDEVPYCKHNVRVFEDCPECENDAEIALQADTAKYVMKLKRQLTDANARIARLQAECHDARILLLIGGLSKEMRDFRYSQYEAHRSAVDSHNDIERECIEKIRTATGDTTPIAPF